MSRVLLWLGLCLAFGSLWLFTADADQALRNASYVPGHDITRSEPNYLGWGGLALAFLTLCSSHYFKLREARRADRTEAREIHDRQRNFEDRD
jgi:hypothetical protein